MKDVCKNCNGKGIERTEQGVGVVCEACDGDGVIFDDFNNRRWKKARMFSRKQDEL